MFSKIIQRHIPNLITLLRIILLPIMVYLLWDKNNTNNTLALIVFIIIGISDFIDGYLARKLNAVTNIGKIVDPTADKLTILIVSLMLMHLGRLNVIYPILILSREMLVITLRAVASTENIIIPASTEAKHKTTFQMLGLGGFIINNPTTILLGHILLIISIIIAWHSGAKYLLAYLKKTKQF